MKLACAAFLFVLPGSIILPAQIAPFWTAAASGGAHAGKVLVVTNVAGQANSGLISGLAAPRSSVPAECGASTRRVEPGTYVAFPYTCVVVAPDYPGDERAVHDPENLTAPMPMVKPGFRLIPRGRPAGSPSTNRALTLPEKP